MDERLNVSFDRFIRTTEPRASSLRAGDLAAHGRRPATSTVDAYSGWYSVRDEAYYAEDETTVGEDNVRRGPQGTPVEWVEEKSYFFRLSAYQDRLLRSTRAIPTSSARTRARNEVMSFVSGGLARICRSRARPSTGASRCPTTTST